MTPKLSDEAWALLGMLYRARHGGSRAPQGFQEAYEELRAHGLVEEDRITEQGQDALRDKELNDDMTLPPRVRRPPK